MRPGWWSSWVHRPQGLWLRRAAFQVHLWGGLALSTYVIVLSVTGSALVYRRELSTAFQVERPAYDPARATLAEPGIRAAAARAYPGWVVTKVRAEISPRDPAALVWVEERGTSRARQRLFDPYTGADLGDAFPSGVLALNWIADLHDELLLGRGGRAVNGAGSALVTLLVFSGAVVWWPGVRRWRRALSIRRAVGWRRFTWDLHSAMGAWLLPVLVLWGISGVYLSFPQPTTDFVDNLLRMEDARGRRPSDTIFYWLARLHFGRFREAPVAQAFWVPFGLVPAVMCVTGVVMWWNRVLRRRPGVAEHPLPKTPEVASLQPSGR